MVACTERKPDTSSDVLRQNQEKWQEKKIIDYTLEVMVVNSIWHVQKYSLTVNNGSLINSNVVCSPAPMEFGSCTIQAFEISDYQIQGLFGKAKEMLESDSSAYTKIEYDPDFGFPAEIIYDDPSVVDEDWSWRVISFMQIPGK